VFGIKKNPFKQYIKNLLGFVPKDLSLYEQALAHRSMAGCAANMVKNTKANNERLEYLGDAVLSAVVADFLYRKYPYGDEGFLTNLRSKLVSREHLNKLSRKIGLDVYIKKNNINLNLSRSVNGDAFEALIGAMYLDKGYNVSRKVIIKRILGLYIDIDTLEKMDTNYKGRLLIWAQKYKKTIEYKVHQKLVVPNKQKQYVVQLFIDNQFVSEGCDFTIKGAEQHAAMYACEDLEL
jgi:ribonuclease-3